MPQRAASCPSGTGLSSAVSPAPYVTSPKAQKFPSPTDAQCVACGRGPACSCPANHGDQSSVQDTAKATQQTGQPMIRKRRLPSSFVQRTPSSGAACTAQHRVRQPAQPAVPPDALAQHDGKRRLPASILAAVEACQRGGSGLKPLQLPQARLSVAEQASPLHP